MATFPLTRGRRKEIAEAVRQRAAALFAHPDPDFRPEDAPAAVGPEPATGQRGGAARSAGEQASGLPPAGRRQRWRLALLERLPAAVQLRCGLHMRSVAALGVLALVAVVFAVHHFWSGRPQPVGLPRAVRSERPLVPARSPGPAAVPDASPARIVVDVTGKVREPGVHTLPAGSRVADALKAAGGALPGTDTSALNLARVLGDGEQVVVGAPRMAQGPAGAPGGAPGQAGPAGAAGAGTVPLSLSTATAEQLDTLPGVGPVLARHIIDYRTRHGGFTSVDQLREVKGIGERRFNELKPLVRP